MNSTTTVRKTLVATASATALILAACGTDSGSGSPTEQGTTHTVTDSAAAATSDSASTTSTPADNPPEASDGGVSAAALTPDCSVGIEGTAVQAMIDRGALPVWNVNGPQDGEITNLEVLSDHYAPCDGLSYALIGGTYQGEAAAFPVFFSHGATIRGVGSFLGSPDMEITGDGTTVTANSTFNNVTFTGTYTADRFGSVTERSQGAGTKSVEITAAGELYDATPRTTQYTFPVAGGTARCLVAPEHLECENQAGTWAFNKGEPTTAIRYDYGAHEMHPIDAVDDSAVTGTETLSAAHTVVGPPGHLMDFAVTDSGLTITTPGEMKLRIDANTASMEMPATTM